MMLPGFYDDSEAPPSRSRPRQTVTPAFSNCTLLGVDEPKDRRKLFSNFNEYHLKLIDNEGKTQKLTLSYNNPLYPVMDDVSHPLPNMVNTSKVDLHELQPIKTYNPLGRTTYNYDFRNFRQFKDPIKDLATKVETVYFNDGLRRIDYVLAYEEYDGRNPQTEERRKDKRETFEQNLEREGLQTEIEDKQYSQDGKTYFLKIHAPWEVLTRYAELMSLKMPIKELDEEELRTSKQFCSSCRPQTFEYDRNLIPDEPQYFTCAFNRERESQFVIKDKETFFSTAQRSRIVWEILLRTRYDKEHYSKVGIVRLINNGTYTAAFPLHEPHKISHEVNIGQLREELKLAEKGKYDQTTEEILQNANTRTLLYLEWARPACWYKRQPLLLIRKYFGDKIGIYFAWLGFYTSMLIPAAIVGLLCFLYGVFTLSDSLPAAEICDESGVGNLIICPLCDKSCPYRKLHESCDFSKVTYLFDNPATVFFSIFMSFWATMFLEFWKRYQARMVWEWDLAHLEEEEEPPRPEFEISVHSQRINPVTKSPEAFLPSWNRSLRIIAASSLVLFMLAVVLSAVFGVIVYRIAVQTVLFSSNDPFIKENAKITVAVTSACLNLIIILVLDKVYQRIAIYLTNMERPRTQTDYENSFTFKMFLFQSINFYSSLIYIAFFKGSFIGHPGDHSTYTVSGFRLDMCDPSGCLFELCVQLAIIMVGKQMMNNIMEILYPKILNWWRARKSKANTKQLYTRWEKDYDLEPLDTMTLFNEYLEMVIQYGFITIFVASFPLAPLFALLNNIVEIRLDAYKFVTQIRRPMAARANDIGAWLQILKTISSAAVIVNAFVIAYTSGFIPRMVYLYQYSKSGNLTGYIENILSQFNTSDYQPGQTGPDKSDDNPEICWYRDYRNPPNDKEPYDRSLQYWHVFAARLVFVVIFEHLVFGLTGFMAYIIPDIPSDVKVNIRREKILAKEALYTAELEKLNRENANRQQLNRRQENTQQNNPEFQPSYAASQTPESTNSFELSPSPTARDDVKLFNSL